MARTIHTTAIAHVCLGSARLGRSTRRSMHAQEQNCDALRCAALLWRRSGAVYTWGCGKSGQLGLGDTTQRNVPTQVASLDGAASGWRLRCAFVRRGAARSQ